MIPINPPCHSLSSLLDSDVSSASLRSTLRSSPLSRRVPPCSIVPDGPRKPQGHRRTTYINYFMSVEAIQVPSQDVRFGSRDSEPSRICRDSRTSPVFPRNNQLLSIETWYLQPTACRRNWTTILILDLIIEIPCLMKTSFTKDSLVRPLCGVRESYSLLEDESPRETALPPRASRLFLKGTGREFGISMRTNNTNRNTSSCAF